MKQRSSSVSYLMHQLTIPADLSLSVFFPPVHPLPFILPSGELFHCLDFHPFGKLLLCRPFNPPFVHPFGKVFLGRPFYSPSVHPFGELFSSRSFHSPSSHLFGELFSSRSFYSPSSHLFGELFVSCSFTLHPSIRLASYF